MSKKKDPPFRVGDRFIITTPRFVQRVGYPLSIWDVERELMQTVHHERIKKFLNDFGIALEGSYDGMSIYDDGRAIRSIRLALSRHILANRGFGGNERSIHEIEHPDLKDCIYPVYSTRIVKTGTRVPGSGWGEDYDPPYFEHKSTHTLIGFQHHLGKNFILEIDSKHVQHFTT